MHYVADLLAAFSFGHHLPDVIHQIILFLPFSVF